MCGRYTDEESVVKDWFLLSARFLLDMGTGSERKDFSSQTSTDKGRRGRRTGRVTLCPGDHVKGFTRSGKEAPVVSIKYKRNYSMYE